MNKGQVEVAARVALDVDPLDVRLERVALRDIGRVFPVDHAARPVDRLRTTPGVNGVSRLLLNKNPSFAAAAKTHPLRRTRNPCRPDRELDPRRRLREPLIRLLGLLYRPDRLAVEGPRQLGRAPVDRVDVVLLVRVGGAVGRAVVIVADVAFPEPVRVPRRGVARGPLDVDLVFDAANSDRGASDSTGRQSDKKNTLPHGDEGSDDAGGADRLDARRDGAVQDVPGCRDFGAASVLGQGQDEFAILDDGRLGAVDCMCVRACGSVFRLALSSPAKVRVGTHEYRG